MAIRNRRSLAVPVKWFHGGSSLIISITIFVLLFYVFRHSPVDQVMDSNFSTMVTQSLLDHRTFTLDHYNIPRLHPFERPGIVHTGYPYQLEEVDGHLYYYFPPGSSILSIPFVALMNLRGWSAVNGDGTYNPIGEIKIEIISAAVLMAVLGVLFFNTAHYFLPIGWSIIVSLGGALGTQVWSTASRALWSDTWGILLLGCVVLILVRQEKGQGDINPLLLATLLSWMYFVRPTYSIAIIAITIYIGLFYRALFISYALMGASWLLIFVTYSWIHFHQVLPNYYLASRLTFNTFWIAFLGNLISPSRGLFLFVPVLFFILYLLVRYRRNILSPKLLILSLIVSIGHLVIISGFPYWWGGHSYGPRLTTGLVPWFVLIGILAIRAMLDSQGDRGIGTVRRKEMAFGLVVLGFSIFINGYGAISTAGIAWNTIPENVDQNPNRLWEWRYPQFLAGIVTPVQVFSFPEDWDGTLDIDVGISKVRKYLGSGWSEDERSDERTWAWAEGKKATLEIPLKPGQDYDMAITATSIGAPDKEQRISIWLNGKYVTELIIEQRWDTYHIGLPAPFIKKLNNLEIDFSYAVSPAVLHHTSDTRLLSVSFDRIVFHPRLQ